MINMIKQWIIPDTINNTLRLQVAILCLIGVCVVYIIIDSIRIIKEYLKAGENSEEKM